MATIVITNNKKEISVNNNDQTNQLWLKRIGKEVLALMPASIRQLMTNLSEGQLAEIEEIRLRKGRSICFKLRNQDVTITSQGKVSAKLETGYITCEDDLLHTLQSISNSSVYALEEEFRRGFITIKGGHRVGIVGRGVLVQGHLKTQKDFSSINIRFAREVRGVAQRILPLLVDQRDNTINHLIVISPPGCGKTTLLRDLVRLISDGSPEHNLLGVDVGLVDERSEIAACYRGIPQNNVGQRTDVLDGCPKATGMNMLLRSMNPKVIATDELGSEQDVTAIQETLNSGVKLITTVHGYGLADMINKPIYQVFKHNQAAVKYIVLSKRLGPGTVEGIYDAIAREVST